MSAEDSKLKSKGHGGGEWNHTIMTEEGDTLPAVRDTTVISGKSHAKVSTRKGGGGGGGGSSSPSSLPLLFPLFSSSFLLFSFPFFFILLHIDFGASLSEPHTSVTAFAEVVCMSACGHIP